MPELPEVETIKRDLEVSLISKKIRDIRIFDDRVIRNCSGRKFIKQCKGQKVTGITRRGKAIILSLENGYITVQPMMTGQLIISQEKSNDKYDKSTTIVFYLSNKAVLIYNDQRLFGRVCFVQRLEDVQFFRTLGPEPLEEDFDTAWIGSQIKRRTGPIKSVLMNQQFIAGIGNIYASEILFGSRIKPQRPARSLSQAEIKSLHSSTIRVIKEAIRYRGVSMRNYRDGLGREGKYKKRIKVYGRDHESCLECAYPIKKIVQSGRSTYYCGHCQR